MSGSQDDDRVIERMRVMMRANGLLEDLPSELVPDSASAERVLARVLAGARRGHRFRLIAAAAAAVVAVAGAGVMEIVGDARPAAAAPPALEYSAGAPAALKDTAPAVSALNTLARRAAASAQPGDGDTQHVTVTGWLISVDADTATSELVPTTTSTWLLPDGSAQIEQQRGSALGGNGRLAPQTGDHSDEDSTVDVIPAGTFDPGLVRRLPRAVEPLRHELLTLAAGMQCTSEAEQAWCLADEIQQLYTTYVIPPDLASALWGVLAQEPAVRDLGMATDRLGRKVRAVAVDAPAATPSDQVVSLLMSPATGQLIGTETTTLNDETLGISTPTVTGFQTWIDARFVDVAPGVPSS